MRPVDPRNTATFDSLQTDRILIARLVYKEVQRTFTKLSISSKTRTDRHDTVLPIITLETRSVVKLYRIRARRAHMEATSMRYASDKFLRLFYSSIHLFRWRRRYWHRISLTRTKVRCTTNAPSPSPPTNRGSGINLHIIRTCRGTTGMGASPSSPRTCSWWPVGPCRGSSASAWLRSPCELRFGKGMGITGNRENDHFGDIFLVLYECIFSVPSNNQAQTLPLLLT